MLTLHSLIKQSTKKFNIMLNLKGILTVKDEVQSGTSRSTGKPWQSQWVVISHKDFEGIDPLQKILMLGRLKARGVGDDRE